MLSSTKRRTNKQISSLEMDKPYNKRFQSQDQVQGHAYAYRHVKFECGSLNIVRDVAS